MRPIDLPSSSAGMVPAEEAASLLKATLDATADGILVVDENGKTIVFNRQFAALWKISPAAAATGEYDALIGEVLQQLEDPAGFVRRVMEIYSDPEKDSFDALVFKDGRRFDRRSMPRRIGGRCAGRVWSFRDVTDLVRTEQELARAHSLLRATFDATADGILVVDNDGDLVDFNRKVVEMWGIPSELVTAFDRHRLRAWVSEQVKNPERFLKKLREIYSEPEGQSYDWVHFKDGRVFERYSKPQKIGDKVVGRVWSFRDVTGEKRLEEEVRSLRPPRLTPS
jgi:PAS domain S-box-containing protein